jgi:osmoprotectant transport system ATP-binding protein
MNPADGFVEDFVGADRALKRLSLLRVRDIDLWRAPLVRAGEPTAGARAAINAADVPFPLVVDEHGRPLGWMSQRDLQSDLVPDQPDVSPDPILDREDVLRDALSDLLRSDTQYGPVVDGRGVVVGVLSVEIISDFLNSPEAAAHLTAAAERAEG